MADDTSLEDLLSAMVPLTLHSESRGRDFNAQGQPLTSSAGARYAMQVMPGTGGDPGFGVRPASDPNDPTEVNRVGRDYLGAMLKRYNMDPAKAWAAYNGGPGRVDRALAAGGDWLSRMPGETRAYVSNNLAGLNGPTPQSQPAQPTNPLPSPAMTDSPLASLTASTDQGDQTGSAQPATPAQPSALDTLTSILKGYQGLDQDRAALRQQQLATATAALQQQRKGLSPTDLFRLSAALAAPQRYQGFGGMMANVSPVLAEIGSEHDQANQARQKALATLQQTYMGGMIDDRGKSLGNQLEVAKAITTADKPDKPRMTWSENLNRFISPDSRQPIGRVVNGGMVGVKYSDGTEEYASPDGTVKVYDAAGRQIATRSNNAASSNAASSAEDD